MQTELEIAKMLIPAGAGLVGALGGAWLGAALAFRRFRSERAFDRQVTWYEDTCSALRASITALASAVAAARNRLPIEEHHRAMREVVAAHPALVASFGQAPMYASASALVAFTGMMDEFVSMPLPRPVDASDPSRGYQWNADVVEHIASIQYDLVRQLAAEFRLHVGLKPLAPSWWGRQTQRLRKSRIAH